MNLARRFAESALARYPDATVVGRGNALLRLHLGNGQLQDFTTRGLHYQDATGAWQETDTTLTVCGDGRADLCAIGTRLDILFNRYLTPGGAVVEIHDGPHFIRYRPGPLYYSDSGSNLADPNSLELAATLRETYGSAAGDAVTWRGAYGPGTSLVWCAEYYGVSKKLVLDSLDALPTPSCSGSDVRLELPLGLELSPELSARISTRLINLENDTTTAYGVDLHEDGETWLRLERPYAVDADGERVWGKLRFRRLVTGSLGVYASVPYSFLATASYPVTIDPTLTEEAASGDDDMYANASGAFTAASVLFIGHRTAADPDYQIQLYFAPALTANTTLSDARLGLVPTVFQGPAPPMAVLGVKEAASTPPTTYAEFAAKPLTTTAVDWTLPNTQVEVVRETPNLAAVVQEIIDLTGFVPGQKIGLLVRHKTRTYTQLDRWRAYAFESGGTTRPYLTLTYTTGGAPAQPTGFSAVPGNGQVQLNWSANAEPNLSGYRLQRDGLQIYQGSALAFLADGLTNNQAYTFALRAYNGASDESSPATLSATPRAVVERTVTLRPRTSGDDGYSYAGTDSNGGVATSQPVIYIHDISSTRVDYLSHVRLELDAGQTLPQGTPLKRGTLYVTSKGGSSLSSPQTFAFEQSDNPVAPTTRSAQLARSKTAAVVYDPDGPWTAEDVHAVDVTAIAQTIINRPGFNSGPMLVYWRSGLTNHDGSSNNNNAAYSFDGDPQKAFRLELVYDVKAPPTLTNALRGA